MKKWFALLLLIAAIGVMGCEGNGAGDEAEPAPAAGTEPADDLDVADPVEGAPAETNE